jgi:hypothetical protein
MLTLKLLQLIIKVLKMFDLFEENSLNKMCIFKLIFFKS